MSVRRLLLLAPFVALASLALWVSRGEAEPGTVKEIVPGVWFREGEIQQMGLCNNVIIEMSDYLIVIDANFPSGAELALAAAKKVSPKPVRYVFDTHHHGDHAYGNPVWTKAGATTLAYVGVAEEMRRYEPAGWQRAAKNRKDIAALNLSTAEPPQKTFSQTPFVLEDASRRVEFHHFGWAHTRGDGFAYLPNEKVLATGDAVVNGAYNFTGHGNTGNWPNVLRKLKSTLDVEHVLPGHGGASGPELIDGQMRFFEEINKAVEAAFQQKKNISEVVTVENGRGVKTTIQLPDAVQNWVGNGFPEQIRVRWTELAEGKPHGEILGGK
jgi:glyoxylase-like metal-dependent hydrolase (beta-lactamase superfamily II)